MEEISTSNIDIAEQPPNDDLELMEEIATVKIYRNDTFQLSGFDYCSILDGSTFHGHAVMGKSKKPLQQLNTSDSQLIEMIDVEAKRIYSKLIKITKNEADQRVSKFIYNGTLES